MSKPVAKSSEIRIKVGLDEKGVPVQMDWMAEDGKNEKWQQSEAMLLSLFDPTTLDTLKIDLWTTQMQVGQMDRMMYQTLKALADSYFRATQNREMASQMQQFAQYFGEKTEVVPKG